MGIEVTREVRTHGERCIRCGRHANSGMVFDRSIGGARCYDMDGCDVRRAKNMAAGRPATQSALDLAP